MSKPQPVTGYKCLEGNIHETLQGCAECNVRQRLADHVSENNDVCYAVEKQKSVLAQMPRGLIDSILAAEVTMVAHWITKQPELLETVIRLYLEESSGENFTKPQKEAKS